MDKMLYFGKILANKIRYAYDNFTDVGYKILNLPEEGMDNKTKLRMKNNKYVYLEDLYGFVDHEELMNLVYVDEKYGDEDSLEDFNDDELENLVGILFVNDYLYEVLYDFGMLGDTFHDENKDKVVEDLLKTIFKVAGVFDYDLHFLNGRIYITFEKKPLDDGSFICRDMTEVEVLHQLRSGAGLIEAREVSGMSKEEFEAFWKRLEIHEWKQTSASDDKEFMEKLQNEKR